MTKPGQIEPAKRSQSRNGTPVKKPAVTRIRFQLGGGLFVAIVLPTMVRFQSLFGNFQFDDHVIHSVVGSALALAIGYIISRRLSKFPGDAARPHILVIYPVVFALVIVIFFMLRLEYNRYLFFSSFVICLIWFVAVHFTVRQLVKTRLAIIPSGNTENLLKIKHVQWTKLETPQMYDVKYGSMVVDLRSDLSPEWVKFIADSSLDGIAVFHSKQAMEMLTGKVDIEHLSENNFGSLLPEMDYLRFKQAIDIIATIVLLPVLLVIMAVVGITILITSGSPVFFKQQRIGYRGAIFIAYKFRTMIVADDEDDFLVDGQVDGKAGQKIRLRAMTSEGDKRITRFGRFLRKYRIDELPQAINILKGEMGWIGPRPEALALSHWYQDELPFYSYRHVVRPGITGWAQVNQGHVTQADQVLEKLHYDFFYIKNLSVWLDLLIVLRTVRVVFFGTGAK